MEICLPSQGSSDCLSSIEQVLHLIPWFFPVFLVVGIIRRNTNPYLTMRVEYV